MSWPSFVAAVAERAIEWLAVRRPAVAAVPAAATGSAAEWFAAAAYTHCSPD